MPEVRLDPGEPKEIIPDIDTDAPGHNVTHVSGAPVQLAHRKAEAVENPTEVVEPFDRMKLGNYRGSSVWAYAETGARIRVSERGFLAEFLNPSANQRPGDVASRRSEISSTSMQGSPVSVASGGSTNVQFNPASWDVEPQYEGAPLYVEGLFVTVYDTYSNDVKLRWYLEDDDGSDLANLFGNPENHPLNQDPAVKVPHDGSITAFIENYSSSGITLVPGVLFRWGVGE